MATYLAIECACKIDWTVPDCLHWFPYNSADSTIISVPQRQATNSQWGLRGDVLCGAAHPMAVLLYVDKFYDNGKSREFADAV